MRVFISFSGDRSAAVAGAIRDWLPNVIQATKPWMSQTDIEKGSRWTMDIANILAEASIGIICVTPENVLEPWIAFEAGALSKTLTTTRVCTYLFDLNPADLPYPLAMFQHTRADQADTRKLVQSINTALGDERMEAHRIDAIFDTWWPRLETALSRIPTAFVTNKSVRADREILEELLTLVRGQINEKRDEEMLARIHSFRSVLTDLFTTVQTSGKNDPAVSRRLENIRDELEQAGQAFDQLLEFMNREHPSQRQIKAAPTGESLS